MPRKSKNPQKRVAIKKSVRFDVLKRDLFKCQYCGSTAPDVLLQIDHINPVSKGGTNDITNLITSCQQCNAGKSNNLLAENQSLNKSRRQLEDLQKRRDQLDMMLAWRTSLKDFDSEVVIKVADYWSDQLTSYSANKAGLKLIEKWLKTYSTDELCNAIDISIAQYVKYDGDKEARESVEHSFSKIVGICRTNRESKKNPHIQALYYVRGILNNRFSGRFNQWKIIQEMQYALEHGVSIEEIKETSTTTRNITHFRESINNLISEYLNGQG